MSENIITLSAEELTKRLTELNVEIPEGTTRGQLISMLSKANKEAPTNTGDNDIFPNNPGAINPDLGQDDPNIPAPKTLVEPEVFPGGHNQVKAPDDKMLVDKGMMEDILRQLNELKNKDGAVDLTTASKRKRIIRVPVYQDEQGKEYLVTGLRSKTSRDGSIKTTWERGRDEITEQIITWCDPILVDLDTGIVQDSKDIRYSEFANVITTISVEVERETSEPVDMTPKASENEVVEQASYEEAADGFYRRRGTGVMVKIKVWGVKKTFTIVYEGREYVIDESVVNFK